MFITLAFTFFVPAIAQAYTGVTIVISAPTAVNLEFVADFKQELIATKNQNLKVKMVDLTESDKLVVAENSELVIALGVNALTAASKLKHTTPVLGVFTPISVFNELLEKSRRDLSIFSAILLDQPYWRQMSLIKTVLPGAKKVGVLLGTTSSQNSDALLGESEAAGINLDIENVNAESELIPQLNKTLENNDALLAVPDPLIYSRETAQPILLTSYRHQKPIIGYSQSYVHAGALAAVFSSTQQLAKQAAEIAVASQQTPGLLPPPQVPKYFSVQVNRQVARSLNISIINDAEIYSRLLQAESTKRVGVK